jgi:hypothetical protein
MVVIVANYAFDSFPGTQSEDCFVNFKVDILNLNVADVIIKCPESSVMEVAVSTCSARSLLGKRKRENHSSVSRANFIRDGQLFLRLKSATTEPRDDSPEIFNLESLGPGVHLVPYLGVSLLKVS